MNANALRRSTKICILSCLTSCVWGQSLQCVNLSVSFWNNRPRDTH